MVTQAIIYPNTVIKIRDLTSSIMVRDVSGKEPVELGVTEE